MNVLIVKIITSKDCKLCERAKTIIKKAAEISGVEVFIDELGIDTDRSDEAVQFAVDYKLDHVPSLVINDRVFFEENFDLKDIIDAIKSSTDLKNE